MLLLDIVDLPAEDQFDRDIAPLQVVPLKRYGRMAIATIAAILAGGFLYTLVTSENLEWSAVGRYMFDPIIIQGVILTVQITVLAVASIGAVALARVGRRASEEAGETTVVDTDVIAHELTQAGGPAIPDVERIFGRDVIGPSGAMDRKKMRERVFADPVAKKALENLLHPMIREESRRRIAAARGPYVVHVVPLLVESGEYRASVDRVLVVDCPEEAQVTRVKARKDEVVAHANALRIPATRARSSSWDSSSLATTARPMPALPPVTRAALTGKAGSRAGRRRSSGCRRA